MQASWQSASSPVSPRRCTSSSVSYPVVLRVPQPTPALASGATATATITLGQVTGVLTVPNSALTTLVAGSGFVQTVKAGQATRTLVRTGAVGATRTQVLSGLTLGQRVVIADLSASPHVDLQAAEVLGGLAAELANAGIRLQVVEARSAVRDMLRSEGLDEKLGGVNRFTSVADAVDDFQTSPSTPRT